MEFLPISQQDMEHRGWDALDVLLISGDAYVDHPSYGTAIIGRVLEHAGFRVGIVPQPDWRDTRDFMRLGRPRLFVGVSAGNLDSMVAHYTSNKKRRRKDDYSPGGRMGLRPDRATIVYANRVREVFGDIPVILGGIEASLRRFAHYDWWDNKVRRAILVDARADMVVYGMGEVQIIEVAARLDRAQDLQGIPGTAIIMKDPSSLPEAIEIPSFAEVSRDRERFNEAFRSIYTNQDPFLGKPILQVQDARFVVQFPPAHPLGEKGLDRIYELSYRRQWHPIYDEQGGVPGFETVRHSIVSHRGCCGECSFCTLSMHQGRIVQSRSKASIIAEADRLARGSDFRGTISDIGGPTVNLYKARCSRWKNAGACRDRHCLTPEKCRHLRLGYGESVQLYRAVMAIPKVKHLFLESGLRYDLLADDSAAAYLKQVCAHHVSGWLKVAPEHTEAKVLRLMNKPDAGSYETFVERFRQASRETGKKQYLVNYFISAHPGSTLDDTLRLALYLQKHGIHPEQIQDFMPLPLTLSGTIYYTGSHPFTGEKVYVARTFRERKMHRALLQYDNPANRGLIREALGILKKGELMSTFFPATRPGGKWTPGK